MFIEVRIYRVLAFTLFTLLSFNASAQTEDCPQPGAAENLARAKAFLTENANKEGVVTTASGLQYKVLGEGRSENKPRARDTVSTHYELFNLDGKKLESTYDTKAPLQFSIGKVIAGWREALVDMKLGEKRTLYISPELAYGCKGSPPKIGPNELLIFNMELKYIVQ